MSENYAENSATSPAPDGVVLNGDERLVKDGFRISVLCRGCNLNTTPNAIPSIVDVGCRLRWWCWQWSMMMRKEKMWLMTVTREEQALAGQGSAESDRAAG